MANLKDTTRKVNTYIPVEMKEQFQKLCEEKGYTMSFAMKQYIYQAIKNNTL